MNYTPEQLYCAKYLSGTGISSKEFDDLVLKSESLEGNYTVVRREAKDFYYELAQKLRDLWPSGEKDGKYPWRDSVENLRRRLIHLWAVRFSDKTYSIEECLVCARRYLSQFEESTKYMKILKYFILKQTDSVSPDGKLYKVNESVLADMLDSGMGTVASDDIDYDFDIPAEEGLLI